MNGHWGYGKAAPALGDESAILAILAEGKEGNGGGQLAIREGRSIDGPESASGAGLGHLHRWRLLPLCNSSIGPIPPFIPFNLSNLPFLPFCFFFWPNHTKRCAFGGRREPAAAAEKVAKGHKCATKEVDRKKQHFYFTKGEKLKKACLKKWNWIWDWICDAGVKKWETKEKGRIKNFVGIGRNNSSLTD
jgi:hypothetical protein